MPDHTPLTLPECSRLNAASVVAGFGSSNAGLSSTEVDRRLGLYGHNSIDTKRRSSELIEILRHFRSPLVLILLFAASVSWYLHESVNAAIIFMMVLISIGVDYFQERDARNAAAKLKSAVANTVDVVRNGQIAEVFAELLVPGDIVLLNAGKIVPADARVLEAKDFYVNQSSLTGESFPNAKTPNAMDATDDDLSSLGNIVFMGSSVLTGSGKVMVVETGARTEFGKIAARLVAADEETDFSRGIRLFGFLILRVTIVLVLFIFLVNALLHRDIVESFMFSLAVAVGLTPELLPMVMSVTMAKGSIRMAARGAIVKRLSAIPNFGSMDVLCTDKTGTLTEDKIRLIKCVDVDGGHSDELFSYAYYNSFFQTGIKNPLDDAILQYRQLPTESITKLDEIPFDFVRKRMSVVIQQEDSKPLIICKGAPEEVFKVSIMDPGVVTQAQELYEQLSADGFRVIAISTAEVPGTKNFSKADETQLYFSGFIAFLDPPKEDADETVAALASIGVEMKIITGDNHLVTEKICKEIGLPVKSILHGHELEHMTDDALAKRAVDTTIFSRFSPDQKNRVILALKKFHHAVGYMGDGINDAPSLRTADIGISVNSATDVAKEAADIILTRKDLLVLKDGILEGRKTFGNTMKYILMGLSSNFGNMFSVAAATLFLPFLPMLPAQILVNNFLYDTSQVTIPLDNVDESYTQRPQRWNLQAIRNYMIVFGLVSSVFDLCTFYLLYKLFAVTEAQFQTGWFMESLATQILVVFIIRTNKIPFLQSKPARWLVASALTCLALGWLLPYIPLGALLGFKALPMQLVGYILLLVLIYLAVAELVKRGINRSLSAKQMLKPPSH